MLLLTPEQISFGISVNWNTKIMQSFIYENLGKTLHRSTIGKMIKSLGFSYTRPTYVLAKANKEKQAEFELQLSELK